LEKLFLEYYSSRAGGGGGIEHGGVLAGDETAIGDRQRRVGIAVGLAFVVGGDGQALLADGQRAAGVRETVIPIQPARGGDGIGARIESGGIDLKKKIF
jgi:hypothetical protein